MRDELALGPAGWWILAFLVCWTESGCAAIEAYREGQRLRYEACALPVDGPIERVLEAARRGAIRIAGVAQVTASTPEKFEVAAQGARVVGRLGKDGKVILRYQQYDSEHFKWQDSPQDVFACAVLEELDQGQAQLAKAEAERKVQAIVVGEVPPESKYFGKRDAILGDGPVDYLLAADLGFHAAGADSKKQAGSWEESGIEQTTEVTLRGGLLFSLDYTAHPSSYAPGYTHISEYLLGVTPDCLFWGDRFVFAPGVNLHYRSQWTGPGNEGAKRTALESFEFGSGALVDGQEIGGYVRFTYSAPPWVGGYVRLDLANINHSPNFGIGFGYEFHPKGIVGLAAGAAAILIIGFPLAYYVAHGGPLPFPNPP